MKLRLESKRGSVLSVSIGIWVSQRKAYATTIAIFDTGAYKTIVDVHLAKLLNLPVSSAEGISTVTATGVTDTRSSVLPLMRIGKMPIKNIPVNVMQLPEELETKCILGMNILQEYDIHISSFNKEITLTPKPLPKKYYREGYSVTLVAAEGSGTHEDDAATSAIDSEKLHIVHSPCGVFPGSSSDSILRLGKSG